MTINSDNNDLNRSMYCNHRRGCASRYGRYLVCFWCVTSRTSGPRPRSWLWPRARPGTGKRPRTPSQPRPWTTLFFRTLQRLSRVRVSRARVRECVCGVRAAVHAVIALAPRRGGNADGRQMRTKNTRGKKSRTKRDDKGRPGEDAEKLQLESVRPAGWCFRCSGAPRDRSVVRVRDVALYRRRKKTK